MNKYKGDVFTIEKSFFFQLDVILQNENKVKPDVKILKETFEHSGI